MLQALSVDTGRVENVVTRIPCARSNVAARANFKRANLDSYAAISLHYFAVSISLSSRSTSMSQFFTQSRSQGTVQPQVRSALSLPTICTLLLHYNSAVGHQGAAIRLVRALIEVSYSAGPELIPFSLEGNEWSL